jgi:hypothetical protein
VTVRRFVYTQNGAPLPEPIEVGADWSDAPASTGDGLSTQLAQGVQMPDGSYVTSRAEYARYLRQHNAVPESEVSPEFTARVRADAERERKASIKADVVEAFRSRRKY